MARNDTPTLDLPPEGLQTTRRRSAEILREMELERTIERLEREAESLERKRLKRERSQWWHRAIMPPSSLNSESSREDSNSQPQAIADDFGWLRPTKEQRLWRLFLSNTCDLWDTSYETPVLDTVFGEAYRSAFGLRRSHYTHPSSDGGWSNMRSAPTPKGTSRFASSTPSSHTPEDCDDIRDANNTPREQWDPSPGLARSPPASSYHPFVAHVKHPSGLSGKLDGINSDGGGWDPRIALRDQSTPAYHPSVHPPLRTTNPLALSNSVGGSNARLRGSVHSKGRDGPNFFPLNNKHFPPDSVVPDITREIRKKTLVASGGYSLVYRAVRKKSQGSSDKVAVKILRIPRPDNERDKTLKRLEREARVWKSLNHLNIVPLLGLVLGKSGPGLVSPWYAHGTVLQYIRRVPNVRREALCEDVANGLRYLHEHDPPVIHGDLKGANILVGMDGRAALCDFGLSVKLDGCRTGFTSSAIGATFRYMAYEQLNDNTGSRSPPSDIYAYACTYAEIMTGVLPFIRYKRAPVIMRAICEGESPYEIGTIVSQHNLGFLSLSWNQEPACRPTIADICQTLGMSQPIQEI